MDESYSPHQLVYLNGHSPPDDSMHWITLGELEREDDPNVDALSGVLLLRVIKYKVNDKDPKDGNIIYKNQKHNSSSYNNYDRMIAVMDANSPPGENLAWILCASNRNDGIFNNYTKGMCRFKVYTISWTVLLLLFGCTSCDTLLSSLIERT